MLKYDDESGIGTVTITDYAQKSLGDVVFVELPEAGATIKQGGQLVPPAKNKIPDPPFQEESLMLRPLQIPLGLWRVSKRPRTLCVPALQLH